MIETLVRRVGILVPTLLIGSIVVFSLEQFVPGGAALAVAGENASPAVVAKLNHEMGLDRPLAVQYLAWLWNAVHGDFGRSLVGRQSVSEEMWARLPVTLALTLITLVLAVVVGVTLGMVSGIWSSRRAGAAVVTASGIGIALPQFWLAMIFVLVFALRLRMLPATGYVPPSQSVPGFIVSIVLPVGALSVSGAAVLTRQVRSAVVDTMRSPFILSARALGLSRRRTYLKLVLKNALLSVVTVIGLVAAGLLGGEVVIEAVFVLPGLGSMLVPAVTNKDFPIVQGVAFIYLVIVALINFAVDLAYSGLDPRIRRV